MKSALTVAVISLAYLYASFNSCHGLICYVCASLDYGNPKCENIKGVDLTRDFGSTADFCMKMLTYKEAPDNVTAGQITQTERLLRRGGFRASAYSDFEKNMKLHQSSGFKVDMFKCHEDRCNDV